MKRRRAIVEETIAEEICVELKRDGYEEVTRDSNKEECMVIEGIRR